MKDVRCLVGFHKWVGKRRDRDQQTESLWDVADDQGYVVWCKRCGKDRREGMAWMGGYGGGIE
jgi:hypothetical protein